MEQEGGHKMSYYNYYDKKQDQRAMSLPPGEWPPPLHPDPISIEQEIQSMYRNVWTNMSFERFKELVLKWIKSKSKKDFYKWVEPKLKKSNHR